MATNRSRRLRKKMRVDEFQELGLIWLGLLMHQYLKPISMQL